MYTTLWNVASFLYCIRLELFIFSVFAIVIITFICIAPI
jgi:hypothetical protein